MSEQAPEDAMLAPFRVLDLTDERGFLCGRILGDLGADVIKIERPGGDPARRMGPFYRGIPHPEKSLFWWAYNANKRGITLNLEMTDGKELFRKLVEKADIVVESLLTTDSLKSELSYSQLGKVKPSIVVTSITPFGLTGTHKHYKGPDLIGTALAGCTYLTGDPDRAPLYVSFPQAYLHAAAQAAAATMIALWHRELSGEGQQVDVSMQQSLVLASLNAIPCWELNGEVLSRAGSMRQGAGGRLARQTWRCRDGFVTFTVMVGVAGGRSSKALVEWMDNEGMADDFIKNYDWLAVGTTRSTTQQIQESLEQRIGSFFLSHTMAELYQGAVKRRIQLFPVATVRDIVNDPQLRSRDFWVEMEHPELGQAIVYPGDFVKASETSLQMRRRAPLVGEHNLEVFREVGLSEEQILFLRQRGVI